MLKNTFKLDSKANGWVMSYLGACMVFGKYFRGERGGGQVVMGWVVWCGDWVGWPSNTHHAFGAVQLSNERHSFLYNFKYI
jgi:hypothetical protein